MTYNKFQPGTIVEIDGSEYLPQGYSGGRLLLFHRTKGTHYLCEQPDGSMALPSDQQFDGLLLDQKVVIRTPLSGNEIRNFNAQSEWAVGDVAVIDEKALQRSVLCELLDNHGVKNGNKAIEKALKKLWTPDLIEKHGIAPSPRTI